MIRAWFDNSTQTNQGDFRVVRVIAYDDQKPISESAEVEPMGEVTLKESLTDGKVCAMDLRVTSDDSSVLAVLLEFVRDLVANQWGQKELFIHETEEADPKVSAFWKRLGAKPVITVKRLSL